jgi:murein DD-endopeptidase MepM/ murein hydrolase activator NlpD
MDQSPSPVAAKPGRIVSFLAWVLALSLVGVALYLGWHERRPRRTPATAAGAIAQASAPKFESSGDDSASLPEFRISTNLQSTAIPRHLNFHTIIPNRPGVEVRDYTVDAGDSVFEIAQKFNIKPETVLWANYEQLNDNPDTISVGMELKIPPVDGVYYQWQDGDTVEDIAGRFEAKPVDILNWPGNHLDLTNPNPEPGSWILVPGGHREFRQWIIPTIPRGNAGVSRSVYGGGACEGGYSGAYGSGTFAWPASNHSLSGNDYWSGHLGIDIAAGEGAPIYAADSGVVVFAGWATGGYGNMVMLDHGNGYQTLYAHMSSVAVGCGQSVGKGGIIGYAGSTGNSTGAHLHFEVRFQGGFVSPWFVLPAP